MSEIEFSVLFPKEFAYFTENELTFSIFNMKSRVISSVYFIFYSYDMDDNLINTYVSPRWIVDNTYSTYHHTFTIPESTVSSSSYYQIELVAVDVTSENPLYFNHLMLKEGDEPSEYHKPFDLVEELNVKFNKSRYCNLYDNEGNFLQVMRPNGKDITLKNIHADTVTVLAPHFDSESELDNPVNLFYEYMNQTEQTINVLR